MAQGRVGIFDSLGAAEHEFGSLGFGPGEFQAPHAIAVVDDTVFVMDSRRRGQLMRFDLAGAYAGLTTVEHVASIAGLRSDGHRLFVTPMPSDSGVASRAVLVADSRGRTQGHACESTPKEDEPRARKNSILRMYVFGDVAIRGDTVYCSQPISPAIQRAVLTADPAQTTVSRIAVAPPFYVPAPDGKATTSTRAVMHHSALWTAPTRVFATPRGILSVYATYDTLGDRRRYFLFRCDVLGTALAHCASTESPGRPVAFREPDRLYVDVPAPRDSAPHLLVLKVTT